MTWRTVLDGNAFYEIDEECERKRREKQERERKEQEKRMRRSGRETPGT